jgi:hypothetical protein
LRWGRGGASVLKLQENKETGIYLFEDLLGVLLEFIVSVSKPIEG